MRKFVDNMLISIVNLCLKLRFLYISTRLARIDLIRVGESLRAVDPESGEVTFSYCPKIVSYVETVGARERAIAKFNSSH